METAVLTGFGWLRTNRPAAVFLPSAPTGPCGGSRQLSPAVLLGSSERPGGPRPAWDTAGTPISPGPTADSELPPQTVEMG